MTSINTNNSAIAALQTLRTINGQLQNTQQQVSSGLRVQKASDNSAYWSIATTMRSDGGAVKAASDAISLGQAKVDTAYNGLESVLSVMSDIKAKLVSATEGSVDKNKVQEDLEQLKQQVIGIAASSSFNGQNWLNTDVPDMYDVSNNSASVVSSFTRTSSGSVAVTTADTHLSTTSLFNSTGGGILQRDDRNVGTIGGIRQSVSYVDHGKETSVWVPQAHGGTVAGFAFTYSGTLTFDDPADQISFDVTVDKDNPADGIPPPYNPGQTSSVTIDRSTIDAVNPAWNGVVSSFRQYQQVLNYALGHPATGSYASLQTDYKGNIIPDRIAVYSSQNRSFGTEGSYVEVSNFSSNVGSGGLGNVSAQGSRGSTLPLTFDQFQDFKDGDNPAGVTINFDFSINSAASKSYSFDRTYVNNLLGVENGKVETSDQMVTLLTSLLSADWPTLQIEATSGSQITLRTDVLQDRLSGSGTGIYFSNMRVSDEPLPEIDFKDLDIAKNPDKVSDYLTYIETVSQKITSGAAELGSLQSRLTEQSDFASRMVDSIDSGVGRLTDADMEEESSKLAAQQTQQQLALQSLSIANSAPQSLLTLFR